MSNKYIIKVIDKHGIETEIEQEGYDAQFIYRPPQDGAPQVKLNFLTEEQIGYCFNTCYDCLAGKKHKITCDICQEDQDDCEKLYGDEHK